MLYLKDNEMKVISGGFPAPSVYNIVTPSGQVITSFNSGDRNLDNMTLALIDAANINDHGLDLVKVIGPQP